LLRHVNSISSRKGIYFRALVFGVVVSGDFRVFHIRFGVTRFL